MSGSRFVLLASASLLVVSSLWVSGFVAQTSPASESFTLFGVGQPSGPVTPGHLRMHQPLYLLDLCRLVKAGRLDRESVEPLVGGDMILSALLAMDLDFLYEKLTAPGDLTTTPLPSLWQRILTNDGVAPLPPLDPPDAVSFRDVLPRESPSQTIRVAAPLDGSIQAAVDAGSPFRILSMRTYDGLLIAQRQETNGKGPGADRNPTLLTDTFLSPQFARVQLPWRVPVLAGQDVEIEVGIPAGVTLPPGGLKDQIHIGDGVINFWTVDMVAVPLGSDIYVYIYGANFKPIQLTSPVVIQSSLNKQPFVVPMIVANPFPPSMVQGSVQLVSGPQGLSMSPVNFTLQPNGQAFLFPTLYIDNGSPAYSNTFVSQHFSLKVSYRDVPAFNAGSQTINLHYTIYPDSRYWQTSGSAQGVNCFRNATLFATGVWTSYGQCDNFNYYQAVVDEDDHIGSLSIAYQPRYFLQANSIVPKAASGSFNKSDYSSLLGQSLIAKWSVCTPSFVFC